jgi:exodeoxyribonuclease V beta subunit
MKKAINFDVNTIGLNGSNLIEASAGTGKTYSVAILALRLIIEKHIPIQNILMVTFTNAAVAELESRIRKFVREGYKYASGKKIKDAGIMEIVGESDKEKKADLLHSALLSLDNLSVMTINSFCQKTIDEFTFETGQSFDYEVINDDSFLFTELVNKFRREVVNTIEDYEWFKKVNSYLKYDRMAEVLRKSLQDKKFLDIDPDLNQSINETISQSNEAYKELNKQIIANFSIIKTTKVHGASNISKNRDSAAQFLPVFIKECCLGKKYISEFSFLYEPYGRNYAESFQKVEHCFYASFLNSARTSIQKLKQEKAYISYDDQISTIHKALKNTSLKEKLSRKYQAVFIDEFQDTDKHQYEIFNSLFSDKSILFFIGDPKQSIYGFRGADLDTYKVAKESIGESMFSMNKNYRSTKEMIDALNILMNPDPGFNMFMDDEIRYLNVEHGASDLGEMKDHDKKIVPITIWNFDEDDFKANSNKLAQEILRLLKGKAKINNRSIVPGDIGVLVRDRKEGNEVKRALTQLNIPSVKRDETRVLKSKEAEMIKNLLKAVISPNRGFINRALNSPYFGFSTDDLKTLNNEKQIEIFIGLKKILFEEGVYNLISSFLSIYGVREKCIKDVSGNRVITNISQIMEILHKVEKQNKYSPDELLIWMERSSEEVNEEFEQRIENDDDAVQISTIHKAKGLQYNIVFAPSLSIIPKKKLLDKGRLNEYKKGEEYYFTLHYAGLSDDDKKCHDIQKEQENRRLIYVALTRPVYKCYISLVPKTYDKSPRKSSLENITDYYKNTSDLIETIEVNISHNHTVSGAYTKPDGERVFQPKDTPKIEIKNPFAIHSFSALSKAHHSAPFEKADLSAQNQYDHFIFQELGRGASVGNALHSIFEQLDFTHPESWEQTLVESSKFYSNILKKEQIDKFATMLKHVMNTEIDCNGHKLKLSGIRNDQKLPEMEFCFSLDKINKTEINSLPGEDASLSGEADLEGLMTGFIDLVFEHQGKYYILDWKSNHLGNSIENYKRESLKEAMKGSNYNLQYLIYTVAVKRWLECRIMDFDYEKQFGGIIYVFLRGVREGMETGIYTALPKRKELDLLDFALKIK